MATVAIYDKYVKEVQDYDIDFSKWLSTFSDSISGYTLKSDVVIAVVSSNRTGNIVKIWLASGTSGQSYDITVLGNTTGGRTKAAGITIKVR